MTTFRHSLIEYSGLYYHFLDGYINPDLGSYAKGKWSQLQIFFEAVAMSEKYPMGVKVSHRAFSSDRVKLLKRLPNEDNSENVRFKDLLKEIKAIFLVSFLMRRKCWKRKTPMKMRKIENWTMGLKF